MAPVALRDYLNEIDDLIERGSLDQATQHCRHILGQHPKAIEVYRLLGKALLEQEDDRSAQDVFQRVLSVDPEDFVARVGLSIIHDRNDELEPAIWHMERAFEIAPSNPLIQGELRRLYARRDGDAPDRIPLTRAALARMYAAGDLNTEAITDLHQLLTEQSDRIDLRVQLAEVLWRDEQHVEAAEQTQQITTALPYCLKANLILGAILRANNANGESDEPLQRAQAVDPENAYAQRMYGGMGPLFQQSVMVDYLELQTIDQLLEAPLPMTESEEIPEWLRGLSDLQQPMLEEPDSANAARLSPGLHMPDVATEVPDWLQGLTGEPAAAEAEVPNWLAALTGAAVAGAAVEALSDREHEPDEVIVRPSDEVVPDWITQLSQTGELKAAEAQKEEEDEPAWMAQLREQPPAPFSQQVSAASDTETPDWLAQLQASESTLQEQPITPEVDWTAPEHEALPAPFSQQVSSSADSETPDWLAKLQETESTTTAEPPADRNDWLAQLSATSAEQPAVDDKSGGDFGIGKAVAGLAGLAAVGAAIVHKAGEEEPTPESAQPIEAAATESPIGATTEVPVVTEPTATVEPEVPEEMPSADDALAFLAMLAAGKEDELRAQAEQDADVRMAEIMGRKPEAKPAPEEDSGAGLTAGAVVGAAAVAELATVQEEPQTPVAEIPAQPEVPEEMPSADDALAFLAMLAAGKEDELRAQAEQDADARIAEIMGRKPTEAAPAAADEQRSPIKMTVAAATVAAVAAGIAAIPGKSEEKPVEPEPVAAVPEEMPSSDDALAFLSSLAAGKEDELRAQAELEAEARMAEIMGRKPAEDKTGAGAAVVGVAALAAATTPQEEPVAEVPEEMPSADDALAFLSRLAAGKEDELRAQAEQEAEARMAAIMGRSAPVESTAPIEMAAAPADEIEAAEVAEADAWFASAETPEVVEPETDTDVPDWLKAMRPTEEASATPESELPDWLRAMRPTDQSADGGLTALIEEESPLAETPPSDLPDWLRPEAAVEVEETPDDSGISAAGAALALGLISAALEEPAPESVLEEEPTTEDLAAQLAALEEAAARATAVQEAPALPQTSALLSPDWWIQSAGDTGELVLDSLPEPYLSPRARAAEKEKAVTSNAPSETPSAERKLPQTGPLRQTGPLALPQTGPLGTTEATAPTEVETLLTRVHHDDQDYAARLDLARTYWATGNREGAYREYLALVNAGEYTKETMADLETIVEVHEQTDWHRMLGDVYMKAGRLPSALDQYRRALDEV